jgi:hypothetical protein
MTGAVACALGAVDCAHFRGLVAGYEGLNQLCTGTGNSDA